LIEGNYDLAYIDPPYISAQGVGVDYLEFYHFLEGLVGWKVNSAINFLSDLKGYDSLAVEAIEPGDTRDARSSSRQV